MKVLNHGDRVSFPPEDKSNYGRRYGTYIDTHDGVHARILAEDTNKITVIKICRVTKVKRHG